MKFRKRIIGLVTFFILFGLFVAVSIYVVILAQGKRIDDNGTISNTSIIRINSIPSDVTVYLNDQVVPKVDNRVEWLQPGSVKLTLAKEGYKSWEKILSLDAGVVKDVYAQLFPDRINFDKLTTTNVDKMFFAENSDYVFYTVLKQDNPEENGIWKLKLSRNIFDFGVNQPTKIFTLPVNFLKELATKNYELKLSPDTNRILLLLPDESQAYALTLTSNELIDLNSFFGFYPQNLEWFDNSTALIGKFANMIVQLDVNSGQMILISYSPDPIFTSNSDIAFYLKDGSLFKYQNKTSTRVVLPVGYSLPANVTNLYVPKHNSQAVIVKTEDRLSYLDLEKQVVNALENINDVVTISPNGGVIVYTHNDVLYTLTLEESVDRKTLLQKSSLLDFTLAEAKHITFSPSNKTLVILEEDADSAKKIVWFMDADGGNKTQVIEDEFIQGYDLFISNSGVDLYLNLQDSSSSLDLTSHITNIYRFNLRGAE